MRRSEGIHFESGRRPRAALGNSTGDRQMLEYTKTGEGARLSMIVLHDDASRAYANGTAQGLPDTKAGSFLQALYDEAKKDGWFVIGMKDDWKPIFAFEWPAQSSGQDRHRVEKTERPGSHATNVRSGRTPRLRCRPAYLPTCGVQRRDPQQPLHVDSSRPESRRPVTPVKAAA